MPNPCPQCGEPAADFRDGVCLACADDNQARLDEYIAAFKAWHERTDEEKDAAIRDAIRRAS